MLDRASSIVYKFLTLSTLVPYRFGVYAAAWRSLYRLPPKVETVSSFVSNADGYVNSLYLGDMLLLLLNAPFMPAVCGASGWACTICAQVLFRRLLYSRLTQAGFCGLGTASVICFPPFCINYSV